MLFGGGLWDAMGEGCFAVMAVFAFGAWGLKRMAAQAKPETKEAVKKVGAAFFTRFLKR